MSDRFRLAYLLVATVLVSGCATSKPREHASKEAMDGATSANPTVHQAADVQIAMGRSLEESGDLNQAQTAYIEAIKKDSHRADAESRLAILSDRKGKTKEAQKHFARAVKLDPKNADFLCDQGYNFYLQRRWSDAETVLKKAIKLDPGHARSHTNLGLVLASQGDEKEALAEFARAGCDAADSQANLGLVLAMEGKFPESRRAYEAALSTKPNSPAAKEGLHAATVAMDGGRRNSGNIAGAPQKDSAILRTSGTDGSR